MIHFKALLREKALRFISFLYPLTRQHLGFVLLSLAACVSLGGLFILVNEVLNEQETMVDDAVLNFFALHIVSGRLTPFFEAVTFLGSVWFLVAAIAVVTVILLVLKKKKLTLYFLTAMVGGALLTYASKYYYHRLRPPHPLITAENSYSFPSGHAMLSMVFYFSVVFSSFSQKRVLLTKHSPAQQ